MERRSLSGCGGILAAGLALGLAGLAVADESAVAARDAGWLAAARRAREGLQWSDAVIRHDWRLQRNARDGRCRILDPADATVRSGTEEECRRAFRELEAAGTIPPHAGPTVILLHGLGENRDSMRPLAEHLRRSLAADVICFGYASVAAELDDHGSALAEVVASLPARVPISFVGHSLGNLVVRRWMAMADEPALARVRRMVMLGPPNQGSQLAGMAAGLDWLAERAGGSARELVLDWERIAPLLAVPPCEFAIVAGGRGDGRGYNPLLEGDDDAVVRVAETRLEGASDFLVVRVPHEAMMRNATVQLATQAFLETGRFPADGPR